MRTTSTFAFTSHAYSTEIKYEILKRLRMRAYTFATIGFPVMFYLFFGLMNRHLSYNGVNAAKYILVSYAVFGLLGAALFGFGVSLAIERGDGWLELKQASPMPPMAHIVAKLVNCALFCIVILAILLVLGVGLAGVRFSLGELLKLTAVLVSGTVPFAALGMVIGLLTSSNAAAGVVNIVYLPLSFCSGLWIPISLLPKFIQKIAPLLPSYHLVQLAQSAIGAAVSADVLIHVEYLTGFTLVALGFARWLMARSTR